MKVHNSFTIESISITCVSISWKVLNRRYKSWNFDHTHTTVAAVMFPIALLQQMLVTLQPNHIFEKSEPRTLSLVKTLSPKKDQEVSQMSYNGFKTFLSILKNNYLCEWVSVLHALCPLSYVIFTGTFFGANLLGTFKSKLNVLEQTKMKKREFRLNECCAHLHVKLSSILASLSLPSYLACVQNDRSSRSRSYVNG